MSEAAVLWVDALGRELDPTSKFLLSKLARFADQDDCAWARVDDLAEAIGASPRTVQYRLRALETGGYIKPTGRMHRLGTRAVPIWELQVDHALIAAVLGQRRDRRRREAEIRGRAGAVRPVEKPGGNPSDGVSMGADLAPMEDAVCTPMGATVCTRNGTDTNRGERSNDLSLGRAREGEADEDREALEAAFEAAVTAWPNLDDTDVPAARTAFGEAARLAGDPWKVAEAAKGYQGRQKARGRTYGGTGLDKWLRREGWRQGSGEAAAAKAAAPAATPRLPDWAADLRADVACAKGEAFAGSYVDPCSGGEGRVLIPATGFAREKLLTRDVGEVLRRHGVTLGEPVRRVG